MGEVWMCTLLAAAADSNASPPARVRRLMKIGSPPLSQVGLMRTPLSTDVAWLASVVSTVCPARRLLASKCCTDSQPICQLCGVLKQRGSQQ